MKKFRIVSLCLICIGLLISGSAFRLLAAGIWARASASSVTVGSSFSVSIGTDNMFVEGLSASCSGCTITSGLSTPTLDTGETGTVTATLNSQSGATVTFSGSGVDYDNPVASIPVTASASISAQSSGGGNNSGSTNSGGNSNNPEADSEKAEEDKNTDSTLSALTVSIGTLSPAFKADVLSYSLALPYGVKTLNIDAKASSDQATVSGNGLKEIANKDQTFSLVCTSESGAKTTYEIKTILAKKAEVELEFDGLKLGVISGHSGSELSENMIKKSFKIDNKSIDGWVNKTGNMTLLYMEGKNQKQNYYLFDLQAKNVIAKYIPLNYDQIKFGVLEPAKDEQKRAGMKYQKIEINQQEINGWRYNDQTWKDYVLLPGISDEGIKGLYQIDKNQKTIQRLPVEGMYTGKTVQKIQEVSQKYLYLIMGISALSGVLGLILVTNTVRNKKRIRQIRNNQTKYNSKEAEK